MKKPLIIDASVAVKWFIPESDSIAAVRYLGGKQHLIAPDIIRPEVCNIIWKLHGRRLLTGEEASQIVDQFLSLPIEIHDNESLVSYAFEIAVATGRTVYDSLYLALAVESKGVMVTADKRLANGLQNTDFSRFITLLQ